MTLFPIERLSLHVLILFFWSQAVVSSDTQTLRDARFSFAPFATASLPLGLLGGVRSSA
jgi:hypothetical protein